VVKHDRVFIFANQSLVELIEHLKKRGFVADTFNDVSLKFADRIRPVLTPNFELQISQMVHL
jgi:hypothetical protein